MVSRRERRLKKKKEKTQQIRRRQTGKKKKELLSSAVKWGILILIVIGTMWWIFSSVSERVSWPYGDVHWHANLRIEACDDVRSLSDLGSQSVHYGTPTVHTHGDNTYHLEGDPQYEDRATLGAFFDAINVPFSNMGIFEYADGGSCPDGSNEFIVLVNEEQIQNATGYLPKDGDTIDIRFGGEA